MNLSRGLRTHEAAPARHISNELQLRRSVLACLLWESQFYEDGVEIAGRIAELVPKVEPKRVAVLAVEAREQMKLRHAPLLLVREMARHKTHRGLVAETLERVIQRADELCEFVAIYWKDGRVPLSGQVKKGLAAAFPKFDEYQLAKYDRGGPIKLRDVLFLSHAKPRDDQQAGVWKKLIWGRLAVPDTWEVALSAAGADNGVSKREAWDSPRDREQAGRARSAPQPPQPARGRSGREARALGPRVDEHATRAAVPLPGCGALRSAMGDGARGCDAEVCRGAAETRGQNCSARRRLRLDDGAALASFRDAAHRRGLWSRGVAARDW
jgi:hypothetical protein